MQRFRIVNNVVHSCTTAISLAVLQNFEYLRDLAADYRGATLVALATGLVFLFRYSDKFSTVLIEKIPRVSLGLRRVLSGRNFIEGEWPLIVVDVEQKAIVYCGFLTIDFVDGQLLVHGDDWAHDGRHALAFKSIQSNYADGRLQYHYKQVSSQDPDMYGYTEIYFFPAHGVALRHAGEFLDKHHGKPMRFYAVKRGAGPLASRLQGNKARKEAALAFLASIEPKLATMLELPIHTDWE